MSEGNLHKKLLGKEGRDSDSQYGTLPPNYLRPSLRELSTREFYQKEGWLEGLCETLFKIQARDTTINSEVYNGVIHFISCLYCLAVVPQQLSSARYDSNNTVVSVSLCVGIGSIFCGLLANLPFVLAPPTVVTIFLSVFLQQYNLGPQEGNFAVILSGLLLMAFGWRPLGEFVKHLIPVPIQVGTVVGVGLLTTLAGSTEVKFVITGHYKILRMGHLTPEIVITFFGVIVICVAMRYHVKGSFCIAVVACAVLWWIYDQSFPSQIFALPTVTTASFEQSDQSHLSLLTVDLLFLYVLYLNGLVTSLSNLAVLTREDGATPRGRWIFILSGAFTILGGLLTSAPILVSPESSAAIKEGAKTGLSTVVCGVLFLFAAFLGPLFRHIPAAGTSPVLIMIGLILFQNVNRIDWRNVADAAPAFVVLFYIPFTYSIIQGVILGYVMYLSITLCTGELLENFLCLYLTYFPAMEEKLLKYAFLRPYLMGHHSAYRLAMPADSMDEGDTDTIPTDIPQRAPLYPASRRGSLAPAQHDIESADTTADSDGFPLEVPMTLSAKRRASLASGGPVPEVDLHLGMGFASAAKGRRRTRAGSLLPEVAATFQTDLARYIAAEERSEGGAGQGEG